MMKWEEFESYLSDGNHEKAIDLLKTVSPNNTYDVDGNSLLHYVAKAKKDNGNVASYLLSNGCDANVKNRIGDSPLTEAIKLKNVKVVKALLNAGADVKAGNRYERTPLAQAFVGFLNKRSSFGFEIIKALVEAGSDLDVEMLDDGCYSEDAGDADCYEHEKESLLIVAIRHDLVDVAILLVKAGARLDVMDSKDNALPLHLAVTYNQFKLVKLMIEKGADVNDATFSGETSLHNAVSISSYKITKYLLKAGAKVNTRDRFGWSPLHSAVMSDNVDIASLLVESGSQVNVADKEGKTCLHVAAEKLNLKMMGLLIQKGAHVDTLDHCDFTPLFSCLYEAHRTFSANPFSNNLTDLDKIYSRYEVFRHLECLSLLLKHGANVNHVVEDTGLTAIEIAMHFCHSDVVGFLLNNGAVFDYEKRAFPTSAFEKRCNSNSVHKVLRHTALFQVQGRSDGPKNFDQQKLKKEYQDYYTRCLAELELMKTSLVHGNVSFFKVLVDKDIKSIAQNEQVIHAMKQKRNAERFPIFWDLLDKRFSDEVNN